jgi:molybdopterin/thiamine biosynthesis adenylyltransferase
MGKKITAPTALFKSAPTPILLGGDRTSNFDKTFQTFLKKTPIFRIVDEYEGQLRELFYIRNAHLTEGSIEASKHEQHFISSHRKSHADFSFCGSWAYYPWTGMLVHALSEDLYQEVRTARNQQLVTKPEQKRFARAVVGIAGLSIGNSVALTLSYSGGANTMKLADPDVFSASNLNRVRVPLQYLGAKKVHVAAQQIYEINPYAKLILYPEGITDKNIENFLTGTPKLDIVVDEMDDIKLKIFLRLAARSARIPLVMATDNGDNAIVDVERYDLDPYTKPFDTLPQLPLPDVARGISYGEPLALTIKEKVKLATKLVGAHNAAPRMQQSLLYVGNTLKSWPQLGVAAFLGGSALTYVIKKLALGQSVKSGKTHISLDGIFEAKTPPPLTDTLLAHINDPNFYPQENYDVWGVKKSDFPKHAPVKDQLTFILHYATMAASSHNTQPWRFRVTSTHIELLCDMSRALPISDPSKREFFISLGACLFTLRVALARFGFDTHVDYHASITSSHVATIMCTKSTQQNNALSGLFEGIPQRFTDKHDFLPKSLPKTFQKKIHSVTHDAGIDITTISDKKTRTKIANWVASATVNIMKQKPFRQELAQWLRHNYTHQFDGMPASTMGIPDVPSILGPFLMSTVNLATGKDEKTRILSSPLLVILSLTKESPVNWVKLGEVYEHILLLATTHGIHSATLTALVESPMASNATRRELKLPGAPQAFIRLGYSNSPLVRSPRIPTSKLLD